MKVNPDRRQKIPFTLRLDSSVMERLTSAADRLKNPYAPNKTQIVERGIELALQEIANKKGK